MDRMNNGNEDILDESRVTGTLPADDVEERITDSFPISDDVIAERVTESAPADDIERVVASSSNDRERRIERESNRSREKRKNITSLSGRNATYSVLEKIKEGGQASIYRVKNTLDGKEYVAKVYTYGGDNKYKEEIIRVLANNNIPGLIKIEDYGDVNGQSFYILKKLISIENAMQKVVFDDATIFRFVKVLNNAIHNLHNVGLIHSDIKTENIMYDVENKIPVIIDFGSITKGEHIEKELISTTSTEYKFSEGYSPPEYFSSAASHIATGARQKAISEDGGNEDRRANDERNKMLITSAADYYQLGVCFCEIFTKPIEKADGGIKISRLFNSDATAIKQLMTKSVMFPQDILDRPHLANLVKSLVQYDCSDRASYDDINLWLSGKNIKIKDEYNLSHYFCKSMYYRTDDLSEAMVLNWEEAQNDILRGQLEKDFEECKDKKRYIEIQNLRLEYEKSDKTASDLDIMTFKCICIVNPDICLFWKGKLYPIKNKVNLEFAKDVCSSIDKKDNRFIDLFKYGLIRFYYEAKGIYDSRRESEQLKRFRGTIDKIVEVGKQKPEVAALLFADALTPGVLKVRITGGKKEFEEYFSDYNSEFEKNGFDKIIEYYLGAHGQRTSLCELLEKISVHKEYNAYFIKMNLNSIQYTKEDLHTDKLFGIVIAVFNNIQKLIKKDSLINNILHSATYVYMNSYIESYNFFNFIDNGGIEAESIKSDFKAVSNENKKIIGELSDAKHLVGFFVPSYCAIRRIDIRETSDCMFIFEKSITGSGLKIPYSSYIVPTSERGELYLINDNYLATKNVVDSLLNANYKFKYKALKDREKVYEYVVDKNYKVIDSFLTNFVWKTGIKPEECLDNWGIASIYLELFLIILLYLLICAAGVVLVRTVIHAFRDGIKYLFLYRAITLIISICCINKAINYINNDGRVVVANIKNHLASKKLMYHYDLIISAVNEIGGRQTNRNTSPIGHNTFELLECACATNNNVQNAEKYISDNNIMGYLGGYYDVRRLGMIKSIVASSIILLYLLLPVNSLNEYLIAYNYNGAHMTVDKMQDSKLMYYANKPFAMATLKMTEKRCVNNIYDAFNKDNKYSLSEVIQQNNDYKSLFRIIGIPLNKSNDEKLDKMQDSKIAYEAYVLNGSMVSSIEELRELYKVISDDHNYTTAQNAINDYMYSTNIMLQRGIDNNDDYAIEKVKAKYREIMSEPGTYGDLPIILNILDTYQGEERAVRLVSHQLSKLVNDVCRPSYQLYRVGAVKKRNGLYFAKLVFDNSYTNWLISSYKNRFFAINTYSYFDSSYKESEEYPDRAYDLIGIDNVKDSFDMTSADPKTWTDGMFFNVINSANEYIPNEENY